MQSGNGEQMGRSGFSQNFALPALQRAAVRNGKGRNDGAVCIIGHRPLQAQPNGLPHRIPVDEVR